MTIIPSLFTGAAAGAAAAWVGSELGCGLACAGCWAVWAEGVWPGWAGACFSFGASCSGWAVCFSLASPVLQKKPSQLTFLVLKRRWFWNAGQMQS